MEKMRLLNKFGDKKIMRRSLSLIILLGIVAAFITLYTAANKTAEEQTLYIALQAADAQIEKNKLYGWGKLPDGDWSREPLEDLTGSVIAQLNDDDGNTSLHYEEDREHRSSTGWCHNTNEAFTVVARKQLQTREQESYLFISVETEETKPENSDIVRQKIKNIFQNIGSSAQISTCLVGRLDGKLEQDDLTARLNRAFQAIHAQITGKLEQINLVSYSGFSPLIPRSLAVDGQKTNINMAIRYSPYENQTYIIIGSPVITEEY